jgi:uncharacterized heparinase superfamily protein
MIKFDKKIQNEVTLCSENQGSCAKVSLLLFHTIRYLKPVQIYQRLFFMLFKPRLCKSAHEDLRSCSDVNPQFLEKKQSYFPPDRFVFLNCSGNLKQVSSWNDSKMEKLWLYSLHYFDDLNSQNAAERELDHKCLIDRWITENPSGEGNGWEPYPISLRTVNWIKWVLNGHQMSEKQLISLFQQLDWLSQRLEYHLLGNHLIANVKALIFGGLFFSGDRSGRWLDKGLSIMNHQINEQILDDGGHFERSPMYHAIILEDILDIIQMAEVYKKEISDNVVSFWRKIALKMLSALEAMCHPDGEIGFFNDAAMGIAPRLSDLILYADQLKIRYRRDVTKNIQILPTTGYVSITRKSMALLVNIAPIKPDYLPAHAHADTFSFELSIGTQRVFVNSGTSCYGDGPERLRQRKTSAHNTLSVDGEDSSEVWSGFRVARRARIRSSKVENAMDMDIIEASHDGFSRFKSIGLHHRKWCLSDNVLEIEDRLEGSGIHLVCIYFHFHPLIDLYLEQKNLFFLNPNNERIGEIQIESGLNFEIQNHTYHPEFGKSIPSRSFVVMSRTVLPFVCLTRIIAL